MQRLTLAAPGGLENLMLNDVAHPGEPGPGEMRIRIHPSSLTDHDYAVATGAIKTSAGLVPLSDVCGIVDAVGPGVAEFAVGDRPTGHLVHARPAVLDFRGGRNRTVRRAHGLACAGRQWPPESRGRGAHPRHVGRVDLCDSAGQGDGRHRHRHVVE